ncbi:Ppx/GppA phosphatase family protein [Alsobacter soli]|uniref:Ppx/GppA phosphatase family protein n=1 Tax=Alsobacter soli TaxID=2109933 RepID=UPI001FE15832|nr:Ppx/GppA phosphatase family protein [Alsobacter soli]
MAPVGVPSGQRSAHERRTYAALDLGTNNCRLLVARPNGDGFRVVDAFSRIVRLGEGLGGSRRLKETAIARTIDALHVCRTKMEARGVTRARLIATEACRAAENGADFIARVREETRLDLEVVDRETEAHLAVAGCAALADPHAEGSMLFDIGGGSSELAWVAGAARDRRSLRQRVRAWTSLPVGVVTLAERHGGVDVDRRIFEAMVSEVLGHMKSFADEVGSAKRCGRFHLLGTSGTVTTIAGVHLGLKRYDRRQVDGIWMNDADVSDVIEQLLNMSFEERAGNACIGSERADLVLAGCAILEAIRRNFPASRLRIADRGLREGILMQMMDEDGVWTSGRRSHA